MPLEGLDYKRVVTLGDSISDGIGATFPKDNPEYLNRGVVGAGFSNGKVRDHLDEIKQGDLVLVSVGLNDASPDMDVNAYMAKVEAYLNEIKAKGGTPVLMGVSASPPAHDQAWRDTVNNKLNPAYEALAQRMGIKFVSTAPNADEGLNRDASGYHFDSYRPLRNRAFSVARSAAPVAAPEAEDRPRNPQVPPRPAASEEEEEGNPNPLLANQDVPVSPFAILIALLTGDLDALKELGGPNGLSTNGSSLVLDNFNSPALLDLIAKGESGGDYNIAWGGRHPTKDGRSLSEMTIDEVLDWQRRDKSRSSAAGKYQIMEETLRGLKKEMGLTGNEKFDPAMQDRLAMQLLERRGLSKFLSGEMSRETFLNNIALEWAAVPKSNGVGAYNGFNGNHHGPVQTNQLFAALDALKVGSRTAGDLSGAFGGATNATRLASAPAPGTAPKVT